MEAWRRCSKATRVDRIPNEYIINRMVVGKDAVTVPIIQVEETRLEWYGHIRRTDGRRKRGSLRRS